jgi:protein tyrosine phosphatase (PTP) superfamily phosphohydrolase (DUF442 family)
LMSKISRKGLRIHKYISFFMRIAICAAFLIALLAVVGFWSLRPLLFDENFHTVIPNQVYRSAQPSPEALERRIRELGIRSVISLRGESTEPWFKAECAVTEAHGVDFYAMQLGTTSPPPAALKQLINLLDTAKRPLLLHCAAGIERSGIASAVVVLLEGGGIVEAREQFGLTYGFLPWHHDHPEVLDDYEHWLALRLTSHSPGRFRYWVDNKYIPSFYRARIKPLHVPSSIAKGKSVMLRFQATNTSSKPWRFRKSRRDWGIRLAGKMLLLEPGVNGLTSLWDKTGRRLRVRLRDITVAPGEAVVLELRVPPLHKPGRYQFFVDLVKKEKEKGEVPFTCMGSEPLIFELRVEYSEK